MVEKIFIELRNDGSRGLRACSTKENTILIQILNPIEYAEYEDITLNKDDLLELITELQIIHKAISNG